MATPNVPTGLERVGPGVDTTPLFRANISSSESDIQLKARFKVYEAFQDQELLTESGQVLTTENLESLIVDSFIFLDSVDSPYLLDGGTAEAEYLTALPVGMYSVVASTLNNSLEESANSEQLTFTVTLYVEFSDILRWNIQQYLFANSQSINWNVRAYTLNSIVFIWNVRKYVSFIEELLHWNVRSYVPYSEDTFQWNTRAYIYPSDTLNWDVRLFVLDTSTLNWNLIQGVARDSIIWWYIPDNWTKVTENKDIWRIV